VGVGTLDFAAPEQLLEGRSLVQGDVFSLGKIAWYLFEENPPPAMRAIIHRATREIPTERYESAQAFATAVRRRNRRTVVLWLLAALGVLAVILAIVFRAEIKNKIVGYVLPPPAPVPSPPAEEVVPRPEEPVKEEEVAPPENPVEGIERRPDESDQTYFKRMLPLANRGDVRAQTIVAEAYLYGRGTETNGPVAVAWYRKAAETGDASAQASLAYCLLNGRGCDKNYDEAVFWYTKAVEQDDLNALNGLSVCYFRGWGVVKDAKKGFCLAMRAAVCGHVPSQTDVGDCYVRGLGVDPDENLGRIWLERAASKNNKSAQLLLLKLRENRAP
jgi:hypothetical protein